MRYTRQPEPGITTSRFYRISRKYWDKQRPLTGASGKRFRFQNRRIIVRFFFNETSI